MTAESESRRHLYTRLRAAREDQRLTQKQVADRMAVVLGKESHSASSVGHYERGLKDPPLEVMAAWAEALGLRLVVTLDTSSSSRVQVLVPRDVSDAVLALAHLPASKRKVVALVIYSMTDNTDDQEG